MPGGVGRLLVAEDEGVARGEPLARELDAVPQVGDGVLAFGRVDRPEAERRAQAAQERGVGDEAPAQTVSLDEARVLARATPPLERDDVEAPALEPAHDLAGPRLGRAGGALGLGNHRLRTQKRMAVAEERVGVGDAVVGAGAHAQDRLAPPDVGERERQAVDLDPVQAGDEALGLLRVPFRMRPSDEPPAVVAALGRTEGRVHEDVLGVDLLAAPERLEDRTARELHRRVAEHRPVRDLARRGSPGADRVEDARRAASAERVEVRRSGGLVARPSAESVVGAVAEPVEEEDHDRQHGATLPWPAGARPGVRPA